MADVDNQAMDSSQYLYAIRFVLDRDSTIYRFISGFRLQGADGVLCSENPCKIGYGAGSGGMIDARLVTVGPDGTPNLANVLAEERVNAAQRWTDMKRTYGIETPASEFLYFNMGNVTVRAGQMYAMVYRNVDPNPSVNWFSENSPTVEQRYAGPNGTNNLDPSAPGAIDNLDPREAVAWSNDGGSTWMWGSQVGTGPTAAAYAGSPTGDHGARLPWYGWQSSPSATPQSNQPFYAYSQSGSYTLRMRNDSGTTLRFTRAGGYALPGQTIGTVTVANVATGARGTTQPLGSGLSEGPLSATVTVAPGQTYQLSNSGSVALESADQFIRATFGMDSNWAIATIGQGASRAELFAT